MAGMISMYQLYFPSTGRELWIQSDDVRLQRCSALAARKGHRCEAYHGGTKKVWECSKGRSWRRVFCPRGGDSSEWVEITAEKEVAG